MEPKISILTFTTIEQTTRARSYPQPYNERGNPEILFEISQLCMKFEQFPKVILKQKGTDLETKK